MSCYDGRAWKTFTSADGLASDVVYSIAEDRQGNLWFGTDMGVSRYDGLAWRSYLRELGGVYVYSAVKDQSGNLWFGTDQGVTRHDGVAWKTFGTAEGLAHWSVQGAAQGDLGMWFGTLGGTPSSSGHRRSR